MLNEINPVKTDMKRIYIFQFFLLQLIIIAVAKGQFYSSGTEPFSIKWEQIKTEHFKIIYPKGFYAEANKLTNLFTDARPLVDYTMGVRPRKISVLLHNHTVYSNGFVTMAPRRMELVTTPPQNEEAIDWFEDLTLHESRHVAQIGAMGRGITNLIYYLTGQFSYGLPAAQTPLWLIEGDAVVTETVLSKSGRGRLPEFSMYLKALYSDGIYRKISYDKSYFGSYRDFIPDYYQLGYQMSAFSRLRYGADIWQNTIKFVGNYSVLPYALNISLHKFYKTSITGIYTSTIDSLKYLWNKEINKTNLSDYSNIPVRATNCYTSYRYPFKYKDDKIIALKNSLKDIDRIVIIDSTGKERVIHTPGNMFNARLTVKGDMLAWDEVVPDPRWEQRDYSVIKTFDLTSGKLRQITHRSKYFDPSISPDSKYIAVVESSSGHKFSLVILDISTGKEIVKLPSPDNSFLQYPAWFSDYQVCVTGTNTSGRYIYILDIKNHTCKNIYGPTYKNISQLTAWNNFILFRAGFNGTDNIYALEIGGNGIQQVTSVPFGAFDPETSDSSGLVIFAGYTAEGFKPAFETLDVDQWKPVEQKKSVNNWPEQLAKQEKGVFSGTPDSIINYKSKPYFRVSNLLNLHSWAPFYVNPSFDNIQDDPIKSGIILLSQNILSTLTSSIGLSYENKSLFFHPAFTYSGFYPVFDFSGTIGGEPERNIFPENVHLRDTSFLNVNLLLKTYVPLRLINGKYRNIIIPRIETEYENRLYYNNGIKRGITYFNYGIYVYRYLKLAQRDIYPEWGQYINMLFTHTPFEHTQYGNLFTTTGILFFPGLIKNHSLRISGSVQLQKIRRFYYPFNRVTLPRGYSHVIRAFRADEIGKISGDYSLPLFYPDLSIPSVIYIKRIRTNLFSEMGYARNIVEAASAITEKKKAYYNSVGIDLIADFHLFRLILPISAGIRYAYLPKYGEGFPELLLSVDTSIF